MAIMRRCCCFNDTRSGTLAAAIYSLIYGIISLGIAGWGYSVWSFIASNIVVVMFYLEFVAYSLVILCSIICIIGVSKDIAGMVLPLGIAIILMMVLELASYSVWLSQLGFAAIILIIPFVIFLLFLALNIICALCVISQFQELQAGRGRLEDIQAARTTTVVMTTGPIVTQQPPPGTFIVQQQQQPGMMMMQQQPGTMHMQPGMMQMQPGYAQPPPPTNYGQQPPPPPGYGQPAPPGYGPPDDMVKA